MNRVLPWVLMSVLILANCGAIASPSFPGDLLPLPEDAEVLDLRENPVNNGLEISYLSDHNMEALRNLYVDALQGAQEFQITAMPNGYMISAKMADISYNIMLSEDAMDPNPKYAGKKSIYIVLNGLAGGTTSDPQVATNQGQRWPTHELPGLPELKGRIDHVLQADGSLFLEITVENSDVVLDYIEELRKADFSFDAEPELKAGRVEFFAFRGDNILGFVYKAEENYVSMEYLK